MLIEQREYAAGIGANGVFHAGVETIVHMGQHNIEARTKGAKLFCGIEPVFLHAARKPGAKIEKLVQRSGIGTLLPEFQRIPAELRAKGRPHVIVHRSESGGIACAFERFEVEFGQVDAVPIETLHHGAQTCTDGVDAIRILQIHELAPVELRILQQRSFFAPLRMLVPELLADMRKLDPRINQNAVAMAGLGSAGANIHRAPDRRRRNARGSGVDGTDSGGALSSVSAR